MGSSNSRRFRSKPCWLDVLTYSGLQDDGMPPVIEREGPAMQRDHTSVSGTMSLTVQDPSSVHSLTRPDLLTPTHLHHNTDKKKLGFDPDMGSRLYDVRP